MSNLDDFFKKRDKKKKTTTKSKFDTLSTDQLVKNLKATDNVVEPSTPASEAPITQNSTSPKVVEIDSDTVIVTPASRPEPTASEPTRRQKGDQEEEWKPFDEGESRDYTGLRINTQGWKVEDDEEEMYQAGDNDEIEQPNNAWGSKGGKKQDETDEESTATTKDIEDKKEESSATETAAETPKVEEKKTEETAPGVPKKEEETSAPVPAAAPTPGAYIPPSMRNRMTATAAGEAPKPAASAPTSSPSDSGAGSAGAYVPPSMRHRTADPSREPTASGIPTSSVNYRRPNKKEPNLSDTMEFPSLGGMGGGNDKGPTNGNDKFEMPKKSGKSETKADAAMVNVENKFSMLGNN